MHNKGLRLLVSGLRTSLIIAVLGLTAACASITTGTDQSVMVETDPPGADCEMQRDGGIVGMVKSTPGTVRLDKSRKAIALKCQKAGYEDGSLNMESEFQGATFGNILMGGLIGVAIDASSGAANKYPERVIVTMIPVAFDSEAARDSFFARLTQALDERFDGELERTRQECRIQGSGANPGCDSRVQALEQAKGREMALLAAKRSRAKIDPAAAQLASAAPAAAAATPKSSVADRLAELKGLHDRGLITSDEYDRRRREILGEL